MKTDPGRFFEDFRLGQRIRHATPRTLTEGDAALYPTISGSRFAQQSEVAESVSPVKTGALTRLPGGAEMGDGVQRDVRHALAEHGVEGEEVVERPVR